MKVDTPVATMGIRGTAVLVEIDFDVPVQGGAPPAKFQVLVEPDGTTGSYILFDKTTLTPIATVNRPGTQTIINGQGAVSFQSSVQLSPDAQKIISDVFSLKFTDLNNPNTKLTTNFTDSIVPETSFLKLASNDFVPVTLQFFNIPDKPATGPQHGPHVPSSTHIPGPPDGCRVRRFGYRAHRNDRQRRREQPFRHGQLCRHQPRRRSERQGRIFLLRLRERAEGRRHRHADGGATGCDQGSRSAARRGAGSQRQEHRPGRPGPTTLPTARSTSSLPARR